MVPTAIRDQGMRDSEAASNLRALERKTTGNAKLKVLELIKLAAFFAQPTVSCFIE